MYAVISPPIVSIIGKAVKEPPKYLGDNFADLSNNLECK